MWPYSGEGGKHLKDFSKYWPERFLGNICNTESSWKESLERNAALRIPLMHHILLQVFFPEGHTQKEMKPIISLITWYLQVAQCSSLEERTETVQ